MSERGRYLLLAVGCLGLAPAAHPQSASPAAAAPIYDVVSIKPNKAGGGSIRVSIDNERYLATNVSLPMLIQYAYNLKTQDQVIGASGWADSSRFDVQAKIDAEEMAALKKLPQEDANAQRRLMMQALLADRFRLKVHPETKEMQIYDLVLARGGSKLKQADPNDTYENGIKGPDGKSRAGMMMVRNGQLTAQAIPISNLLNNLSAQLHRQVRDKTGLTGKYDITLQWRPDDMPEDSPDTTGAASAPSIFTALQEQLGLKLEPVKGPVDTIVVDHVEAPTEN